ncbi:ribose-5-phosphate isomerase [Paracoccus halophilus]|uniref:Ribose-5-phosphate isomerase A n=1 Tax=Paracoccus halophilus TaxID=376733 RepID=A0A099F6R9_9RHOB|nr:ribose-5-phosphate isomerase RpiA [Paracoccus halophilus]KGJ06410.1 ribose 5-phosphate isomerase [Paracoccus halophilus]SFA38521.1 ribose-5-phosphate isomerase [Paracoccus halophilus]
MTDPAIADQSKDAAATAAVRLVEPGMRLGLGTGSTAAIFVRRLAQRVKAEGFELRCAATSKGTAELAGSLGLRVEELDDIGWLDLTIDGADELDPDLNLIKGGGAAHLREKIVATASDRMVVIADQGKVVNRLGQFHLPVEVIPFGWQATRQLILRALERLDLSQRPVLLRKRDDQPLLTDEGNLILDLALEEIHDPEALAAELSAIAGVVEHGLFLNICQLAIIGRPDGSVVELAREDFE